MPTPPPPSSPSLYFFSLFLCSLTPSNRADLPLFPGFDNIFLGKKERAVLIARGKNPDRKEEHVVNEQPTMTEYMGPEDHSPMDPADEQL